MTPSELRGKIQTLLKEAGYYLGEVDSDFGIKTYTALQALDLDVDETVPADEWPSQEVNRVKASSFADKQDVINFRHCKERGGTNNQCFKVGDNGIGFWEDDTTNPDIPYIAIHRDILTERFGSLSAAKHQKVLVKINGKEAECIVGDICGVKDRIDLAVGAQKLFNLNPPFLVTATWKWATLK